MDVEIIYPAPRKSWLYRAEAYVRWGFAGAAYICPVVNLCMGGKPWSIVALWSLFFVWSMLLSRDLVEYNRISQTAKLLVYTCVLLILIDLCLSSGWAGFVVPIVCFGTLIAIGVLLFSDLRKHQKNIMPVVWLIAASFAAFIASLIGWPALNWPMIALGATAFALLAATVIFLKKDLLFEMKKRFHTR